MKMFNDTPRKTVVEEHLSNYIKYPSVHGDPATWGFYQQSLSIKQRPRDLDIYASMSFSTSTLVLHESRSIVFGSRNRDHKSRDYPHTCSGRYGLELFLEAKLNGNKLTVIPGFWRNTEIRKKYSSQNNRTWTLMADILKVRTERFSPYYHWVFTKLQYRIKAFACIS